MDTTKGPASRRAVLTGAGAAAVLAGCTGGATAHTAPSGPATPQTSGGAIPPGSPTASPTASPVIRVADIPVHGGVIFPDLDGDGVVVTQPSAGVFRAFSATCTHRGCILASVSDGTINCPCHGGRFSIKDGSVVRAGDGIPAPTTPLPAKRVTVSGDQLTVD